MSRSMPPPWILSTLLDLTSAEKERNNQAYQHRPKIVQTISYVGTLNMFVVSDTSHYITVFLTDDCAEKFKSSVCGNLKNGIIQLESYHFSTVTHNLTTRSIEDLSKNNIRARPFAIQCSKVSFIGGSDITVITGQRNDPEEINLTDAVKALKSRYGYRLLVEKLTWSQFPNKTRLPDGNGKFLHPTHFSDVDHNSSGSNSNIYNNNKSSNSSMKSKPNHILSREHTTITSEQTMILDEMAFKAISSHDAILRFHTFCQDSSNSSAIKKKPNADDMEVGNSDKQSMSGTKASVDREGDFNQIPSANYSRFTKKSLSPSISSPADVDELISGFIGEYGSELEGETQTDQNGSFYRQGQTQIDCDAFSPSALTFGHHNSMNTAQTQVDDSHTQFDDSDYDYASPLHGSGKNNSPSKSPNKSPLHSQNNSGSPLSPSTAQKNAFADKYNIFYTQQVDIDDDDQNQSQNQNQTEDATNKNKQKDRKQADVANANPNSNESSHESIGKSPSNSNIDISVNHTGIVVASSGQSEINNNLPDSSIASSQLISDKFLPNSHSSSSSSSFPSSPSSNSSSSSSSSSRKVTLSKAPDVSLARSKVPITPNNNTLTMLSPTPSVEKITLNQEASKLQESQGNAGSSVSKKSITEDESSFSFNKSPNFSQFLDSSMLHVLLQQHQKGNNNMSQQFETQPYFNSQEDNSRGDDLMLSGLKATSVGASVSSNSHEERGVRSADINVFSNQLFTQAELANTGSSGSGVLLPFTQISLNKDGANNFNSTNLSSISKTSNSASSLPSIYLGLSSLTSSLVSPDKTKASFASSLPTFSPQNVQNSQDAMSLSQHHQFYQSSGSADLSPANIKGSKHSIRTNNNSVGNNNDDNDNNNDISSNNNNNDSSSNNNNNSSSNSSRLDRIDREINLPKTVETDALVVNGLFEHILELQRRLKLFESITISAESDFPMILSAVTSGLKKASTSSVPAKKPSKQNFPSLNIVSTAAAAGTSESSNSFVERNAVQIIADMIYEMGYAWAADWANQKSSLLLSDYLERKRFRMTIDDFNIVVNHVAMTSDRATILRRQNTSKSRNHQLKLISLKRASDDRNKWVYGYLQEYDDKSISAKIIFESGFEYTFSEDTFLPVMILSDVKDASGSNHNHDNKISDYDSKPASSESFNQMMGGSASIFNRKTDPQLISEVVFDDLPTPPKPKAAAHGNRNVINKESNKDSSKDNSKDNSKDDNNNYNNYSKTFAIDEKVDALFLGDKKWYKATVIKLKPQVKVRWEVDGSVTEGMSIDQLKKLVNQNSNSNGSVSSSSNNNNSNNNNNPMLKYFNKKPASATSKNYSRNNNNINDNNNNDSSSSNGSISNNKNNSSSSSNNNKNSSRNNVKISELLEKIENINALKRKRETANLNPDVGRVGFIGKYLDIFESMNSKRKKK